MTLVVTPAVDTAVDQPRIRLSVVGTTSAPGPVGGASTVVLYRTDPDGVRRKVIVEANAVLSGGAWVGYDYHAPFNVSVQYSAVVDGVTSGLAAATVTSTASWAMSPSDPTLSVQLDGVQDMGDLVEDTTAVLSYPLGATSPIALTEGVRRAPASSLTVYCLSQASIEAIRALLRDSGPILLNLASINTSAWLPFTWGWVSPGALTRARVESLNASARLMTFPFTVVDTPAGSEVPIWTYADVAANFGSYQDVATQFRTYSDLATDTVSTAGGSGLLPPDSAEPGYYGTGSLLPDPNASGYYLPGSDTGDSGSSSGTFGLVPEVGHPGYYVAP